MLGLLDSETCNNTLPVGDMPIAVEVEGGAQANVQMAAAQQQTAGMEQIGQAMGAIQKATTQALAGKPSVPPRISMPCPNPSSKQLQHTACDVSLLANALSFQRQYE